MPLLKLETSIERPEFEAREEFQKISTSILSEEIGKSRNFVMVVQSFNCSISFGMDSARPVAFLEIKNVGSLSSEVTQNLSMRLCKLCRDQFSIPPDRIYLEFQESARSHWGWNGKTFQ